MKKLDVIDFFCGAGGFSEGFRQMGFEIISGYDNWKPAVETFNHNFNLKCEMKNILDFKESEDEINKIPNTDVIIGSPPCVSFSSSNKSGKADKSLGVELTEIFLKIVAIKKHQPNSMLKAWFMENVVNSRKYLQSSYSFKDLNLTDWAIRNKFCPSKTAINLNDNCAIINSADYGSYQSRRRIIAGEIIKKGKLIIPEQTHSKKSINGFLPYNSIRKIKDSFPNPYESENVKLIKDIQYPISLKQNLITDHFYDTSIYKSEWRFSKFWKVNHPYMGKMSFPENENNPSRTITATKIANSRESIIYKSEIKRDGNGEYRLPTVREAAIIMGFPITYQFLGSENSKWRLVGNAVCCSVSRAFAETIYKELGYKTPKEIIVSSTPSLTGVNNLNSYKLKVFNNPPVKNKGSRFRRHAIKDGNLTVTLSNYCIEKNNKPDGKWYTSIQYGTGKGFPIQHVENFFFKKIESTIKSQEGGEFFLAKVKKDFCSKIGSSKKIQELYEKQQSSNIYTEPTELVDEVQDILVNMNLKNQLFEQSRNRIFKFKKIIPKKQLFALYAINLISTTANTK